tara:strand:- start:295 stop:1350 length:1056 start_codon:yes stop_codon:yes gene_type:complete
MSKPIILLIHGMGTHPPGNMRKEFIDGINDTAKLFEITDFDIEEKAQIEEFNYSEFLDSRRKADAEYAKSVAGLMTYLQGRGMGERVAKKLSGFFANFDEDEIFYTHWMDVIYYGLTFWGEKIRIDCAKRINDLMCQGHAQVRDVHVVAHSLGTAVFHDTVAKLFRKDADIYDEVPQIDIGRFKLESVTSIANVSRLLNLLNDIADPHHSILKKNGCTNILYNVRNEFDPFTWVKTFDRKSNDVTDYIETTTVRKLNTHDFKEYISHPAVAWLMLNSFLGTSVSANTFAAAMQKYEESSVERSLNELRELVHDIKEGGDFDDRVDAVKALVTKSKALKEKFQHFVSDDGNH